tara:strand:- start:75 stop:872 length:798 start_codon:yes stop_codon:yes gene_type:complete
MVLSVLIRYPYQTKKGNKIFFEKKDQELTNLDWAKWAGWFDTDGSFEKLANNRWWLKRATLSLKDRQPVELFSKIFETSLLYREYKTITPEPYRKEYTAHQHKVTLTGKKATWFTKNVYPYLIKQEKKEYAVKLLGYRPESKDFADWTPDEVTYYLATATEGDGGFRVRHSHTTKNIASEIKSSDVQYLANLRNITENKLGVLYTLSEKHNYETQEGTKTMYGLVVCCSRRNPNNLGFFQSLVKDGVMTLDRKKQKVQEFLSYMS